MSLVPLLLVLMLNQDPHYLIVKNWNKSTGLPHTATTAITQTPDGYLWVGTQSGLTRFNGSEFVTIKNRPDSLACKVISCLSVTATEGLWVGTLGCGLYLQEGHNFTRHPLPEDQISVLEANPASNRLWAIAGEGRLYRLDGHRYHRFPATDILDNGAHKVLDMQVDVRDGSLWMVGFGGLWHFANNQLQHILLPDETKMDALFQDKEGTIWVGGTYIWKQQGQSWQRVPINSYEGMFTITSFAGQEDVVAALSNGDVLRYEKGSMHPWYRGSQKANSFIDHLIYDREGNLWRASTSLGLSRWRMGKLHYMGGFPGVEYGHTMALMQHSNGQTWVGGNKGKLHIYQNGQPIAVPQKLQQGLLTLAQNITCMAEQNDGAVLIGTRGEGLLRWDGQTLRQLELAAGSGIIRAVVVRPDGIWVAPSNGGLQRDSGLGFRLVGQELGLHRDDIFTMIVDRDGLLWVGSLSSGVYCLRNGKFQNFGLDKGLPSLYVLALFEDSEGRVWVGTVNGLAVEHQDRFAGITRQEGLPDETVIAINQDGAGQLWISFAGMIVHADPQTFHQFIAGETNDSSMVVLQADDGQFPFAGNVAGNTASCRDPLGRVWFASEHGAVVADSRVKPTNTVPVQVMLERVLADDQPMDTIPHQLDYKVKRLEIHFDGACLTAGEKMKFRYRLTGFDNDWRTADERLMAAYTSLPAGNYTFEVTAANNDGLWNQEGLALPFRVLPAPWLTPWAFLGYTFVLGMVVWLLFHWQARRARFRSRQLEVLVAQRTDSLIQAQSHLLENAHRSGRAEQATEVMHNMGNAINSINVSSTLIREELDKSLWLSRFRRVIGLLQDPQQEPTANLAASSLGRKIIEGLQRIEKGLNQQTAHLNQEITTMSVKLATIRDELLAQQSFGPVSPTLEPCELNELIGEVIKTEEPVLKIFKIHTVLDLERTHKVLLSRIRLKHVLLCLLTNAREASRGEGGRIMITTRNLEDGVELMVRDDGQGILEDHLEKVLHQGFTTKEGRTGKGLHYCANALKSMDGTIEVTSDGPNQGTEVCLIFPRFAPGESYY